MDFIEKENILRTYLRTVHPFARWNPPSLGKKNGLAAAAAADLATVIWEY